jgi:3-hydroxybutyryl-CoA dehydrogenase
MVIVAVVGSGLMGRGIAACVAAGGEHEVRLFDTAEKQLQEGVVKAQELCKFMADNGVAADRTGTISGTTSLQQAVLGASFVFEAIFEDMSVKQDIFKQLGDATDAKTILCTNTSSLSVTEIASKCSPQVASRIAAAHFIGPAHLVPLVEVCPGQRTEPTVAPKIVSFLSSIGKKPALLKKEIEGFLAARLQAALYRECMFIANEGVADPAAIDSAVYDGFGRRFNQIGPFQQADFAGVDLTQKTHAKFFPQLGSAQRDTRADELVPQGRLGVKVGKGHHDWTDAKIKETTERRDAELLRRLKVDRERAKMSKL